MIALITVFSAGPAAAQATMTTVSGSPNPSVFGQSVTFRAVVSGLPMQFGSPTGTVTFFDNGAPIASNPLDGSGVATLTTSALTVSTHNIAVTYSGDANYATSDGTTNQIVNKAGTSTNVMSSANPSVSGQSLTYTATVSANSPGSGTPTGSVTFTVAGQTSAAVPLNGSGQAVFDIAPLSVAPLPAGTYTVTVSYVGDTNFQSSSGSLSQVVNQDAAPTSLVSSANPSVSGQSVTYTATVSANSPGSGTPTGTVTFDINGVLNTVSLSGGGQATFTTSTLSVGPTLVIVDYNGDTNFLASRNSLNQTVNQDSSVTTLVGAPNPSNLGQAVTLTATVTALAPGSGTPTGNVTFTDTTTSTTLGTQTLTAGTATFTTSALTGGGHTITASYGGDAKFTTSTGTASQTVNQGTSVTVLTGAPNPSNFGQSVTFTATVTSAGPPGTPSGSVTFKDGATTLFTLVLNRSGQAVFTTSSLTPGAHTISAIYSGDTNFTGSTATLNENVQSLSTTTTLASTPNPSIHNQPVTFTATVASGGGTPTGTVTFFDSGQAIGTGTLAAGAATFTTASLTIGAHSITASYSGALGFLPSTSAALSQGVNEPADSLKLRALQVQGTQIAAQISGDAVSQAIDAAITDGFSDNPSFATPSANGMHVNMTGQLAAGQQLSDSADADAPDPALGRAMVLSDNGTKPAMSTFSSLTSSGAGHSELPGAPPLKPGQTGPSQVAALDPAKTAPGQSQTAAAPVMVGPSPTAWQAWADVRGSGWDNSGAAGDIHGTQVNTLAGLTRRLAPDFLVGALAGYEHFNYSSQLLNGRLTGDGWTVGGYLGWRLDEQLRFDAAVARSGVNYNDTAGTAAASFPGSRWLASAGLTGTYKLMPFEIEPSAKVFALWEHDDPYTDSLQTPQNGFSFSTGRASAGFKLSYPMPWTVTTGLTPYVGLYGDYYFSSNNSNTLLVPSTFIRGGAGRVTAGITARLDSGVKLALGGEYGGIGNDFQNWTVMGRVSVPLSTLFGLPAPMAGRVTAEPIASAAPADAPRTRQLASLHPVADTADAPAILSERIVVRFSEHAVFLTPEGRQAFDHAVAELLAHKPVQVAIDGCDAGADFAEGSLCGRRQASLQQLLAERGLSQPVGLPAEPR